MLRVDSFGDNPGSWTTCSVRNPKNALSGRCVEDGYPDAAQMDLVGRCGGIIM